jgi:hypothetical protein
MALQKFEDNNTAQSPENIYFALIQEAEKLIKEINYKAEFIMVRADEVIRPEQEPVAEKIPVTGLELRLGLLVSRLRYTANAIKTVDIKK